MLSMGWVGPALLCRHIINAAMGNESGAWAQFPRCPPHEELCGLNDGQNRTSVCSGPAAAAVTAP